jgi:hypothetical protein
MYYYHILSGLAVTILTILFVAMSLAPLLTCSEDEPGVTRPEGSAGPLEFPLPDVWHVQPAAARRVDHPGVADSVVPVLGPAKRMVRRGWLAKLS